MADTKFVDCLDLWKPVRLPSWLSGHEIKTKSSSCSAVAGTSGGMFLDSSSNFVGILQSVVDPGRIGRLIHVVNLRGLFTVDTLPPSAGQQLRVVIVHDRQWNGAAGGTSKFAEVFDDPSGVATNNVLALRNVDNERRFEVVYDKLVVLSHEVSPDEAQTAFKFNLDLDIDVIYNSAGQLPTDIETGNLFGMAVSKSATYVVNCVYQMSYVG